MRRGAATPARRQRSLAFWMLAPGLLLVAYLALPLARVLFDQPAAVLGLLGDPEVRHALGLTFLTAAAATLCGLLLAVPLGYGLARTRFRGQRLLLALVDMPLVIPHPVAGIALLLLVARDAKLGRWLAALHLHLVGTALGIVAAMLFVAVPYLVHACRDGFRAVDIRYEELARTLGCGRWQAFYRVALPLARRSIVSGAVLMFARSVSEFGSLIILAYNPRVIALLIYDRFTTYGLSAALPLAALLVLFGFAVIWVVSRLEGSPL